MSFTDWSASVSLASLQGDATETVALRSSCENKNARGGGTRILRVMFTGGTPVPLSNKNARDFAGNCHFGFEPHTRGTLRTRAELFRLASKH